jgi:hypothetical protein
MTGKHFENAGQPMRSEPDDANRQEISVALANVRDSWVLISMALKDHFANMPSPQRDEVMVQVERHLARIREGERGNS